MKMMLFLGGVVCAGALTLLGADPTTNYPTMLEMTFPEFEAALKKTDVVLVPVGAIEEHNAHLPLGTDAMNATPNSFTFSSTSQGGSRDHPWAAA